MGIKAFIAGCAGTRLNGEERAFFAGEQPWGFILFARNIDTPEQVRALTGELRECVGRADAPVLVDQEGGRVQRLRPPRWPAYPPARLLGDLYRRDAAAGLRACWLQSRLIAFDLAALAINIDCLPVLDVPVAGASDVIGDRAYSPEPDEVAQLGRAAADGLISGGVLPVIKHIPGHGRATADSHLELPVVDTERAILGCTDFHPFMQLADLPLAMTAHVVYTAFDRQRPATASPIVIGEVIRGWLGFDGLLMSDDLSMRALSGEFAERARACFAAGCDVVLHCSGAMSEMAAVAAACPVLEGKPAWRARVALERAGGADGSDEAALRAEFAALTGAFA
ncbi:MAG: glycosyl hydrolase [Alphaproteobacteria bacterium]|nr:MAG: glycosyl hydrolase [Alphaproteobacteria bacterium]